MNKKDMKSLLEIHDGIRGIQKALDIIGADFLGDYGAMKKLYEVYDIIQRNSPYYDDPHKRMAFKEADDLEEEFFNLLDAKMSNGKKAELLLREPEEKKGEMKK